MSEWTTYRAQDTLPSIRTDGAGGNPRLNNRAELVVAPIPHEWAADGRLFVASNVARQTALATGGTSFSDTAPAFIIDFPSGTTGIPLSFVLNQGGTVAGATPITVLITIDNKARYSSGGTAITPVNMRLDAPRTSGATVYGTSPTAAAIGTQISLYSALLAADVTPAADSFFPTGVVYEPPYPPYLVGPASIVIYTFAGTTQPSWFYSFVWAEIPTVSVT